jgi:pyruvate formate lyase activating enzyme
MDIIKRLDSIWNEKLTRHDFFRRCVKAAMGMAAGSVFLSGMLSRYRAFAAIGERRGMKEALFYEKWGDDRVKCMLCPEGCVLADGQRGFCRVREPVEGKLYTLVYELICASHIDPIEKKPLYHVLPGTRSFSIATAGCNSRCKYCQNWTISQRPPEEISNSRLTCDGLVSAALSNGCRSIAYTYTEPVIFYEYMIEAAEIAKKKGILNLMITGGKINPEPMARAAAFVDAANLDLKGFDKKYLREVCAQDLDNILRTITLMKDRGMWVELTNLIVPTLNDNMDDIKRMCAWIKQNLGGDVPLHFSRFWPQYKLRSLYPTPVDTLAQARKIAMGEGLNYVYIGNAPETDADNTVCPGCGKVVIRRRGYIVEENRVSAGGNCEFCGHKIAGIWS